MSNKRLYVDFHVLQTVPPSCVNRDDTGRPKTAMYGGVHRARVSSQSWKNAMRNAFREIFTSDKLGFRTKHVPDLIADKLIAGNSALEREKAIKKAAETLSSAGIKINTKAETGALFFISSKQIEKLAELALNGEKEKTLYKNALKELPSIDIALFGRMVADDAELNVDAACQVSHSISTHAIDDEYDYFTAIDDCSPKDNAGAGHLGTMEFNSSTLYRYATVNVMDLKDSIGEDSVNAVLGFARAFIFSMPTGKMNSYANKTLPDLVYVTVRDNQPVNFSGAFEKPVRNLNEGFVRQSIKALRDHAAEVYENYCNEPKFSFVVGYNEGNYDNKDFVKAEKTNIENLLKSLEKILSDEVN